MFYNRTIESKDTPDCYPQLRKAIDEADTIIIGAGAGLSTSAGFVYSGERFEQYFSDFSRKYGFKDMYTGGFVVMKCRPEELWAYWSRFIYINRYMEPPKPVYDQLFELVKDRDYFVLTTNVDHCFQKTGFDKQRLFYTQGDYGLWQCSEPCHQATYDNEDTVRKMVESQGFVIDDDGSLTLPEGVIPKMTVPTELIPHCPVCGKPMSMNLRSDHTFVEDDGWHAASARYDTFLKSHRDKKVLFLEVAVGFNTPGIIKYSFWKMTSDWSDATYACLNYGEAYAPDEIISKSICINGDIGDILDTLKIV